KDYPIGKSIWQRNYWEHVIRNKTEYKHIAQYIIDNPMQWEKDQLKDSNKNIVMEQTAEYNHEIWMI
ncbi:MAG: transposase, partial [Lentisphaeria bacterium]